MAEWLRKRSIYNNIHNNFIKVLLRKLLCRIDPQKMSRLTEKVKGFLFYKKDVRCGRKKVLFLDYER